MDDEDINYVEVICEASELGEGERLNSKMVSRRSPFADTRFYQIPNVSFEEAFKQAFGDSSKALNECKKELIKNTRQKALAAVKEKRKNFTDEDALTVMTYTYKDEESIELSPCRMLRKSLSERNTMAATKVTPYVLYFLRALRRLSLVNIKEPLYRAVNGRFISKETFKKGKILSWKGFTQLSSDKDQTLKGIVEVDDPVLFEVSGGFRGHDISDLSYFKSENNIILEPVTVFRVTEIKKAEHKYTLYALEVLNTGVILSDQISNYFGVGSMSDTTQVFETEIPLSKGNRAFAPDCSILGKSFLMSAYGTTDPGLAVTLLAHLKL